MRVGRAGPSSSSHDCSAFRAAFASRTGAFATLTGLQSLSLRGCVRVTDVGLAHLRALPGLRSLDLWGCKEVTDAGREALKAALPECNIT